LRAGFHKIFDAICVDSVLRGMVWLCNLIARFDLDFARSFPQPSPCLDDDLFSTSVVFSTFPWHALQIQSRIFDMASESKSGGDEVVLVSQEGERFVIQKRLALMSEMVKTMVEDSTGTEEVPLSDVKSSVLAKVVEFCKHHVDNRLPEIEKVGEVL
jgi:hypothetical protein